MWPPKFSDCLEACNVARRRCERLVTTALAQPDVNLVAAVMATARDCSRIATLATQLLERGSKYAYSLCDVCARACDELADACQKQRQNRGFFPLRRSLSKVRQRMCEAGEAQKIRVRHDPLAYWR